MDIEKARFNMVQQQIRPWKVSDERVLDAIQSTPREDFVPEECAKSAFADMAVPLPNGQQMLTPQEEARILQALNIQPNESILEIGTGSGYMTALLAKLGQNVTSVEFFSDLSETAQAKLNDHGLKNITLKVGDAAAGWEEDGSFDVILITGSLFKLPKSFKQIASKTGRIIGIFGQEPTMTVVLFKKINDEVWKEESLFETQVPRLINAKEPDEFVF